MTTSAVPRQLNPLGQSHTNLYPSEQGFESSVYGQDFRLAGGLIDRRKEISFSFDNMQYQAFEGDTLASALLANGTRLLGRSFKYHRPRGLLYSGSEEPNALVELRSGARREPNTRATVVELYDGLEAMSQNRWPSLKYDLLSINDRFANFLTAGFYYKTFMWPAAFWENFYEPIIRRAAGLGSLSMKDDPDLYDKGFLHCDLLIIGSGPAGLAAALTAARANARVILAEEDFLFGGRLLEEGEILSEMGGPEWVEQVLLELQSMPNVRLMRRTTISGAFDHGVFGAVERSADHLPTPDEGKPRQTHWRIYAKRALLCAGATERPIAFENNDRPGIMMAGAMRSYANRWAVAAGKNVTLFTNNSDGYKTARDLHAKGVNIAAVIDTRAEAPELDFAEVYAGAEVIDTSGRLGLTSVKIQMANGETRDIKSDALAVSGGWNPNVHLTCHQRGRPVWNENLLAFVPGGELPKGMEVAGAARGSFLTGDIMQESAKIASKTLSDIDIVASEINLPKARASSYEIEPKWYVGKGKGRGLVDFQNDVTVKDVKLAHQEGFRSVEHLKRYTTLGMATDQGKTSNIGGLAIMAELTGKSIPEVGSTIFRPPYTPVTIGTLAGRSVGEHFRPVRETPSHKWAAEQGAVFVEVGNWYRAQWFPRPGEKTWRESVDREVVATRSSVGVCDVTTLGKIDVQGADAAEFLNKLYVNGFAKLAVGKVRYGLMLREDGLAFDDGTAARFADDHFVVTTTTAKAGPVFRHMEFARQCLWPEMDVQLTSTTDSWAQYSVAGPNARKLLQKIVDSEHDISNDAFPYLACGEITVCSGLKARLFRISFSGELAYEIAVPARYGDALMRKLIQAGEDFDVTPYGMEALGVMRVEKGHAAGNELNGTTTAKNLGLGRMVSTKKDFIGSVLSKRPGLSDRNNLGLVGFIPLDSNDRIESGSSLMAEKGDVDADSNQGYITSTCYSPVVQSYIGIGFMQDGFNRLGETVRIVNPIGKSIFAAKVVSSHFVDPEGERLRA